MKVIVSFSSLTHSVVVFLLLLNLTYTIELLALLRAWIKRLILNTQNMKKKGYELPNQPLENIILLLSVFSFCERTKKQTFYIHPKKSTYVH